MQNDEGLVTLNSKEAMIDNLPKVSRQNRINALRTILQLMRKQADAYRKFLLAFKDKELDETSEPPPVSQDATALVDTEIAELNQEILGTTSVPTHLYESQADFSGKHFKSYRGPQPLFGPNTDSLIHGYLGLILWIDKSLTYLTYLQHIDPIMTLESVSTVLNIVDQVANQIDNFTHQQPDLPSKEVKVIAEKHTRTIEVKREGEIVERITATDIAKLDDDSRKLIKALENSMQNNYDLWIKLYPERDSSSDPINNARVETQLKNIAKKMCSDLDKILHFLERSGKNLDDHYRHVRFVCREIEQA